MILIIKTLEDKNKDEKLFPVTVHSVIVLHRCAGGVTNLGLVVKL